MRMPVALSASQGSAGALAELEAGWAKWMERSREPHYGFIGQDLGKGRRTEIE